MSTTDYPGQPQGAVAALYLPQIRAAESDPQQLERLYQSASEGKETDRFAADMLASYRESPDNLLFAAWYYRLERVAQEAQSSRQNINWRLAILLSVLLGAIYWLLSDPQWVLPGHTPYLAFFWAPITGVVLIWFLTFSTSSHYLRAVLASLAVIAVTVYVFALVVVIPKHSDASQQSYLNLMLAHLPLFAWGALGISVLGWRSSAKNRFGFLAKSIEVIGTAGVYSIAGGIFVGLTAGMFAALRVNAPDLVIRLLVIGGAGLIPVIAVASAYDPAVAPGEQDFRRGFGRILTILMRALLPLTLLVLVIYLCVIPFNFQEPFTQRNVLIVYNVVLFAVMGLLIGVTPISAKDAPARYQRLLRAGVIAVAALVLVVSVYALIAIVYRTTQDQLTMNRLTVIGWNCVNIALLAILLYTQFRRGRAMWVESLQATFRIGTILYLAWGTLLILALPWLF